MSKDNMRVASFFLLCNVITCELARLRIAYPENLAVVREPERHLSFELQVVGKKRESSGKEL
jgi:hypothetical protein